MIPFVNSTSSCCETSFSFLCPKCYGSCVRRNNPAEQLRKLLTTKLFGQEHTFDALVEMFEWFEDSKQLVSFHIAGDNGVGKSYVVQLFSEALFQYENNEGLLVLSGTNYQGAENETLVESHREALFNVIVKQLQKCPRSLIVIDDVEYVHSRTLLVLQQFMDDSVPHVVKKDGTKVFKNKAFLGLISDFGREGRTSNMDYKQLEQLVLDQTAQLWDWDPKQTQLIQHTFPFVSLLDKDVENIIKYNVEKYIPTTHDKFKNLVKKITVSKGALEWMRKSAKETFPYENGRGAKKWVMKILVPKIGKAIIDKKAPLYVDIIFNTKHNELELQVIESYKDEI